MKFYLLCFCSILQLQVDSSKIRLQNAWRNELEILSQLSDIFTALFSHVCKLSVCSKNVYIFLSLYTKQNSVSFPKIQNGVFNFLDNIVININSENKGRFSVYGNSGYTNLNGRGHSKKAASMKRKGRSFQTVMSSGYVVSKN